MSARLRGGGGGWGGDATTKYSFWDLSLNSVAYRRRLRIQKNLKRDRGVGNVLVFVFSAHRGGSLIDGEHRGGGWGGGGLSTRLKPTFSVPLTSRSLVPPEHDPLCPLIMNSSAGVVQPEAAAWHALLYVPRAASAGSPPPPNPPLQAELNRHMIKLRKNGVESSSYGELFPMCEPGSLLEGTAPDKLQAIWKGGEALLASRPGRMKPPAS